MAGNLLAQEPVVAVNISVQEERSGDRVEGVNISVVEKGVVFLEKITDAKGHCYFELPISHSFTMKFKKDGYVTKLAEINTRCKDSNDVMLKIPVNCSVSLFYACEKDDFEFLEKEAVIQLYLDSNCTQTWDVEHSRKMKSKIESGFFAHLSESEKEAYNKNYYEGQQLMEFRMHRDALPYLERAYEIVPCKHEQMQIAYCKEIIADSSKLNASGEEKTYESYIQQADKHYEEGAYSKARDFYRKAGALKPDEKYPQNQIVAAEDKMKEEAKLDIEKQYQKVIEKADEYFEAKDYVKARDLYDRASKLKPTDPYPKQKIEEINKKEEEKKK